MPLTSSANDPRRRTIPRSRPPAPPNHAVPEPQTTNGADDHDKHDAFHSLMSSLVRPSDRMVIVTSTGRREIHITEPTSALHGQLAAEQIAEIRKAIASDDVDDEHTHDGEDDVDVDVDSQEDIDPGSVDFFEECSKIFGEDEATEMRDEIFLAENIRCKETEPSAKDEISEKMEKMTLDAPGGSELVSTPTLQLCMLRFNIRAKLLICTHCSSGVPLSAVPTHLGSCKHDGTRVMTPAQAKTAEVTKHIIDELTQYPKAGVRNAEDILNLPNKPTSNDYAEWHRTMARSMQPREGQQLPEALEGIPVKWKCTVVPSCGRKTFDVPDGCPIHPIADFPGRPPAAVQAMGRGNLQKWIQVFPQSHSSPSSASEPDEIFVEHFTELLFAKHRDSLAKDFMSDNFHPIFRDTGVQNFLESFDPSHIADARTPKGWPLTKELCDALEEVHQQSFMESVQAVHSAPEALRFLILEGCRLPGAAPRFFRVPRKDSTLRFYARRERMLLLAVLKASRVRNGVPKPNPLTLSEELNSAVQKLRLALTKTEQSARLQLETVLDLLYFPLVTVSNVDRPFASPVMAFLAVHCIDRKGRFVSVKNLSSLLLAPAQFAIRARGLKRLVTHWDSSPLESALKDPATFCQAQLAENRLAPYSGVRSLMHAWSRASKNLARSSNMVWIDDETLQVVDDAISVPRLPRMMRETIHDLELYIKKSVLRGIPLTSFCPSIDLEGLASGGNEESWESKRFRVELEKQGELGLTSTAGSENSSNARERRSWRMSIHRALLRMSAAMHTTGGLPPRTTDADAFRLQDLMYIADGNTIGIRSTVGKMKDRENAAIHSVIHVFPPVLAKLLFILIRVVRPVELELLLRDTDSDQTAMTELYRTYVFVSMGSLISNSGRSAALKSWTKSCFGIGLGAGQYRQLATALQRHCLPRLSRDPRTLTDNFTDSVDHRLQRTVGSHREANLELLFIQLAKDWHNFFGLSVVAEMD